MYKLCKIFWSNLEFFTADKPILWKIGNNITYAYIHSIRILTHTYIAYAYIHSIRSAYTAYTHTYALTAAAVVALPTALTTALHYIQNYNRLK
jgi:hypothetical protein